jgi:putative DNA methylase
VRQAGVVAAAGGVVRLIKWAEYPTDWNPTEDARLPVWEALHHLIRIVRTDGEGAAGQVLAAVTSKAPAMRQLAYRLYTLCERAGWAEDARAYNEIIASWAAIESAATARPTDQQAILFDA